MSTYPKSPKAKAGGMMYFPRMLDKIRLFAKGELGRGISQKHGDSAKRGWRLSEFSAREL